MALFFILPYARCTLHAFAPFRYFYTMRSWCEKANINYCSKGVPVIDVIWDEEGQNDDKSQTIIYDEL